MDELVPAPETPDVPGLVARLRSVLPEHWFPEDAPVLGAVLTGFADAWARLFALLDAVRAQTRIKTASGQYLDLVSTDYFARRLIRHDREGDDTFRGRILTALTRTRGTRAAVVAAVLGLTGRAPDIFEPARTTDTGGYSDMAGTGGGLAWNSVGAWGSLALPFQCFVVAHRPRGEGIAVLAGYGTGGPLSYASAASIEGRATDASIFAAVADALPAATVAWTRISD